MTWQWDDLRYLLAVERTGSLAAAAAALRVDQTTVGRRLDALQRDAGARLVERGAVGSRLTDAGRRACAIARRMEESALSLERDVAGVDARIEGVVRINVPDTWVPALTRALADLRAVQHGLVFELLVGAPVNLVRREADLAIRMMVESRATLLTRKLGTVPWGLFAADAYLARRGAPPVDDDGDAWRAHEVIAYLPPIALAPAAQWLAKRAAQAPVVVRVNNAIAAVAAAGEGLGVVAAPVLLASRDGRLRAVSPRAIGAGTFFLVGHKDLAALPRVRATIDHLTHWFRTRW
jgi:DNA-binding transcriptional LysR family regulator